MPLALLQGDASEIRRELARLGLTISPSRSARELLASYLQVVPVEARARCVEKLGWHGDVYVTSTESIGLSSEIMVFQNTNTIESALSVSGTTEQWRDSVSRLAIDNSRMIFAISVAFAPVLAKLTGEDSGGFHFRGASSSGKTTALKVAASVWGNPDTYSRLWRTTANGLEGLAALHNDGLLILDELSQMDPKEAGEAAYLLANGQGKTRATRHGTAKQTNRWSLFFLSAGEESLTSLMAKIGQRANAGQEIRLADIEADAGCGMGIFEQLHEQPDAGSLAIILKEESNNYYGAVGMDWLKKVVAEKKQVTALSNQKIQEFMQMAFVPNCTGQIIRVARRFGLVAAAGELASKYGLTGWSSGTALHAAFKCYRVWLDSFGALGNRERELFCPKLELFLNHMVPVVLIILKCPITNVSIIVQDFTLQQTMATGYTWFYRKYSKKKSVKVWITK